MEGLFWNSINNYDTLKRKYHRHRVRGKVNESGSHLNFDAEVMHDLGESMNGEDQTNLLDS